MSSKRAQVLHAGRVALALMLLLPVQACSRAQQPSVTTIQIGPEILHTQVKRLGINLSGQSFYDSGQMLRNLTFRNPGFEGETWQSILRCKSVTGNTCTDQNQYSTWPAHFLDGAHYQVISGTANGASGTVLASTAASGDHGVTLTLSGKAPTQNDFLLVRIEKPGGPEAGWWTDLQGGATVATEFHDLSPRTPGKQALRINAKAGQSAAITSYFDSYNGRSFLHLHTTLTLTFRAKLLDASATHPPLTVDLTRLDTTRGRHTFFNHTVALAPEWRDYSFTIPANDVAGAVGTIGLSFQFAGASALLDDVALTVPAGESNPTAFRDEVVETLRDLRPGVLRYMDNGTNFGASLDDMLAPPFARRRTGSTTRAALQEDIPIGLHEFLTLAKAVGAEPWYSMPPGTSPTEAAALAEYLAGAPGTRYGSLRATLGQQQPWTEVFPVIHLELGNEQWNYGSFAGATLNDPTAYAQRAGLVFAALDNPKFDRILGSWATNSWWTGQELAAGSHMDSVAVAPYLFNDFEDASSTEAIFGPMLAEAEFVDTKGYMAEQQNAVSCRTLATCAPPHLAVYEVNLGALNGSPAITQTELDATMPSEGAGLAVTSHMLLMLRELGVTTQCLFALPEYQNNFSAPGPHRMVPLWGAVVDMGGPTNLRRPQFLAVQLANRAILPTELATHVTGPNPTWNQPAGPNNVFHVEHVHALQLFAFAEGSRHTLILLNLSRSQAVSVQFAGLNAPSGPVDESRLTSSNITDTNEYHATVVTRTRQIASFAASQPYSLPPYSMTTLSWRSR